MAKIIKLEGDIEITLEIYNEICSELLSIGNRTNVSDELSEIPAQFSYYHGIMIRSKRLLDNAVDAFEQYKAGARTEKRKEGKLTAVAGEDFVNSLASTSVLNKEIQNRQEIYGYAKGICSSLEMKKDMLVQLSANNRMETKLYN
jgi:hypothetical protein